MRARLGDLILSLLAIAGGICILLVVVGLTMNISIMMFRTGSMEPTIPAGSIALVREIPATEMNEGDVVTVDRGNDLLPVTHRVTEITDVDESTGAVTFVMRGDANDTDDPEPYTTETVRRAFFSIPGAAPVIQWFQSPLVLGGLTLGATALVIWAFWPRDDETPKRERRSAHAAPAFTLPIIFMLAAPLAAETHTTETLHGDYLRLRSSGDAERMTNMAPGNPATWVVDIWADAPEPGNIEIALSATGQLAAHPDALTTEVTTCMPHPELRTECAEHSEPDRHVVETNRLALSEDQYHVGTMSSEETRRVLVTATLADALPDEVQDTSASFRLIATGHGEQLSITPDPETQAIAVPREQNDAAAGLAGTGFTGQQWLIFGAMALIAGAIIKTAARRNRPRRTPGTRS